MAKKKKGPKPNAEYELPNGVKLPKVRILALDPGSRNMGISVVGIKDGKPVILANSVMTNPVNTLVDFAEARVKFMEEIARWVEKFEPKAIIAERFQTRGNGGPLIEMVSVMLGLLAGKYETLPVKLITASTWKNAFNRRHQCDLREMYPDVLTPPHAFDSCLIGIYGLEYGTQQQLEYSPSQLMRMAERTSCLPLRKKKE